MVMVVGGSGCNGGFGGEEEVASVTLTVKVVPKGRWVALWWRARVVRASVWCWQCLQVVVVLVVWPASQSAE